jgi:hypothetical protein
MIASCGGTSHEKPPYPLVSLEHLLILRQALDLSIPFYAVIWAVALVALFACHHLGELSVLNLSLPDPKFNVMQFSNPIFRTLCDGTNSLDFRIPWMKSTGERGADVILTARSATHPSGSVPLMSKLGKLRAPHIRKKWTQCGHRRSVL